MRKQAFDDQTERYEQRQRLRRRDFIHRMEQKLEGKVEAYHHQHTRQSRQALHLNHD